MWLCPAGCFAAPQYEASGCSRGAVRPPAQCQPNRAAPGRATGIASSLTELAVLGEHPFRRAEGALPLTALTSCPGTAGATWGPGLLGWGCPLLSQPPEARPCGIPAADFKWETNPLPGLGRDNSSLRGPHLLPKKGLSVAKDFDSPAPPWFMQKEPANLPLTFY